MKKYWRLLGSLVLVSLLVWRVDWRQVGSAFAQLDVTYWLLALGVYAAAQCVSAVRWQMLAGTLGLGGRWWDYLSHYLIGMFFNLVLPTSVGGDVVRAWYLGRQEGSTAPPPQPSPTRGEGERKPSPLVGEREDKPSPLVGEGWVGGNPSVGRGMAAFLSVLADRVNGFAVLIGVACLAALCCPTPLPGWIDWTIAGMGVACVLGLAALPALPWLQKTLPLPARLTHLFDGATLYLRDRRGLIAVTMLSVVVQLANVVLAWLIGEGLGLPIPPLYYGVLVPLVSILTLLPISLNGMGLREGGTVLLLAPLGISAASAVTLSLLIFAVYTTASLGGGIFYLLGRLPRFSEIGVRNQESGIRSQESGIRSQESGISDQGPKDGNEVSAA